MGTSSDLRRRVCKILAYTSFAGLVTAGICFPIMAVLTHFHSTGAMWIYMLGPLGLMLGCILYIAGVIYAHYALGWHFPRNFPAWTSRFLVAYWISNVALQILQYYLLKEGLLLLSAQVLSATYPFILALAPYQTILRPLAAKSP